MYFVWQGLRAGQVFEDARESRAYRKLVSELFLHFKSIILGLFYSWIYEGPGREQGFVPGGVCFLSRGAQPWNTPRNYAFYVYAEGLIHLNHTTVDLYLMIFIEGELCVIYAEMFSEQRKDWGFTCWFMRLIIYWF